MNKYDYNGPERFRPLSPWAYFGYSLLFSIPLIGFIFLIIFALSDTNINRRSFARSFFCGLVLLLILTAVMGFFGFIPQIISTVTQTLGL